MNDISTRGSTSQFVYWNQTWPSAIGVYYSHAELIETSFFTRQFVELWDDEEYRRFQAGLAANPAAESLIRGGGGIRNDRVAGGSQGKHNGAKQFEECSGQLVRQADRATGKGRERGVWR